MYFVTSEPQNQCCLSRILFCFHCGSRILGSLIQKQQKNWRWTIYYFVLGTLFYSHTFHKIKRSDTESVNLLIIANETYHHSNINSQTAIFPQHICMLHRLTYTFDLEVYFTIKNTEKKLDIFQKWKNKKARHLSEMKKQQLLNNSEDFSFPNSIRSHDVSCLGHHQPAQL
jgi:hypothetical protein